MRKSSAGSRSSLVSGVPLIGHTDPRVDNHNSIVDRSNTGPDVPTRTGSFITWPLIAHKNSYNKYLK